MNEVQINPKAQEYAEILESSLQGNCNGGEFFEEVKPENKLLSCPFCGGESMLIHFYCLDADGKMKPKGYFVYCKICGTETVSCTASETAIGLWEKRLESDSSLENLHNLKRDLEPCPFCASLDCKITGIDGDIFYVSCDSQSCGVETGLFDNLHTAIEHWNTRYHQKPEVKGLKLGISIDIDLEEIIDSYIPRTIAEQENKLKLYNVDDDGKFTRKD